VKADRTIKAFSLVELTVVLLIVGLAAAAVALRVRGPLRQAVARDLAGQVAQFDHLTRTQARALDRPLALAVELNRGRLRRTDPESGQVLGPALELPAGCTIAALRLPGEPRATAGEVLLHYSRRGLSTTYALCLEDVARVRHWLLVAGLTGQVETEIEEREVERIVEALESGPDAG